MYKKGIIFISIMLLLIFFTCNMAFADLAAPKIVPAVSIIFYGICIAVAIVIAVTIIKLIKGADHKKTK